MAKWYETLAKVGAGAAAGYTGANAATAVKTVGSLLNRKKKKRTVSDTPSSDWADEASDMPYTDEDIY